MLCKIDEMVLADYEEVVALWADTEGIGLDDADTKEVMAAYLARNPGLSFVARRDGRIVGAVLCGHEGRRGYLHHLAVARSCRGQGIGQALVEACLTKLGSLGIAKCNIFVLADNDLGEAFWKKHGWRELGGLKVMQRATLAPANRTGQDYAES
jgi:ribosomal protein S18 acetylase RimI-like enzyme